jgi:flagellar basal body-associated protein FliL
MVRVSTRKMGCNREGSSMAKQDQFGGKTVMGLLTWIIIGVLVLAIIGIGVGAFFTGVFKGAQQVGNNPVVKNTTGEIKQYITNATQNATKKVIP